MPLGMSVRLFGASALWAYAFALVLVVGCVKHPGCDHGEVEVSLGHVVEVSPSLADIADGMQVFCVSSTEGYSRCRIEAEACTVRVGSGVTPGRMYLANGVPVDGAIAHEAMHWLLWDAEGACASHLPDCGWDVDLVEAMRVQ